MHQGQSLLAVHRHVAANLLSEKPIILRLKIDTAKEERAISPQIVLPLQGLSIIIPASIVYSGFYNKAFHQNKSSFYWS